jgi:hypothetical protein
MLENNFMIVLGTHFDKDLMFVLLPLNIFYNIEEKHFEKMHQDVFCKIDGLTVI